MNIHQIVVSAPGIETPGGCFCSIRQLVAGPSGNVTIFCQRVWKTCQTYRPCVECPYNGYPNDWMRIYVVDY